MAESHEPILEVKELAISYETRTGLVPAVRAVNFTIGPGQTVGLVGESILSFPRPIKADLR